MQTHGRSDAQARRNGISDISTSPAALTPPLRVPPFPGAKRVMLTRLSRQDVRIDDSMLDRLTDRIVELKACGSYWAARPQLPGTTYVLVWVRDKAAREEALAALEPGETILCGAHAGREGAMPRACDPWHLVSGAKQAIVDADDELALIAAMAGVPVRCVGEGRFSDLQKGDRRALRDAFRAAAVQPFEYLDPFSGEEIDIAEAIELCGFWRRMVHSNRDISAAIGFASWKQATVAPLLWDGSSDVPFSSSPRSVSSHDRIAIWKSRTSASALAKVEASEAELIEVEDGFIRSAGLGADCVPPLSIVLDRVGIYFDPRHPSELERLLQEGRFSDETLDRARRLRELIVVLGISKYAAGIEPLSRHQTGKRHLLVPGQVEDDRSIICGGGRVRTNLELLRRVRERQPDAYIIYKPHPDVEAGHRTGAIPDKLCLTLADEIVRDQPISSVIAMVDEVHVNTSLAGFEALLREKPVTTYGVPFFAGWGLTEDLGAVPPRRTARRTLDELVAAALLLYPRYLDPVTNVPCPPETLVRRLAEGAADASRRPLVRLRHLQGRWKRAASALRFW